MIAGFTSPNTIIYDREIKKIRVVLLDIVAITLSMIITICWLLAYPTIWALVSYMLITDTLKAILSFKLFEGQKPRLRIDAESALEIFRFGRWIFLSTALAFLATQGDKLVVSKWVTTEQLGVFSIAIGLAKITELISGSVNMKLMLPLYSEMGQAAGASVLHREARAKMALFLICSPFVLIFSLGGGLLVQFLYDPRYHGAGWMLQIMALGTLFSSHNDTMGSLIISRGRSYAHMLLQAYRVSTLLMSMFIGGYFFGLTGLVYAIALGPALFYPVICLYCRRLGLRSMRYDAVAFALVFLIVFSVWHRLGWPHA
jgi:O-antigen/teichoic acid export membrane protein